MDLESTPGESAGPSAITREILGTVLQKLNQFLPYDFYVHKKLLKNAKKYRNWILQIKFNRGMMVLMKITWYKIIRLNLFNFSL